MIIIDAIIVNSKLRRVLVITKGEKVKWYSIPKIVALVEEMQ